MSAQIQVAVDIELHLRSKSREFHLQVNFSTEQPCTVLFGPSGAGKTATLKAIAGLEGVTRGRIAVGGRELYNSERGIDLPPRQRRVGYVFQDYALFPHLSVRSNIAYGLRSLRWPWLDTSARRRVDELLELFELSPVALMRPQALSGGQRQRVALARALIVEPQLLLLDEPFAALDARLRERMRDELRALQARLQIPMLLITHDLQDVRSLAGALVVIESGRVQRCVEPAHALLHLTDAAATARLAQLCGIA